MENASKALIMAGGMLIAGLLIALLAYAWNTFSEYQSSKDELKSIEDTAKFNEQFANYDRKDVLGYEILSLLNKVVDYNERRTSDSKYGNDDMYPPVSMSIILDSKSDDKTNRKKLTYNGNILLFNDYQYLDADKIDAETNKRKSFRKDIIEKIDSIKENLKLDENTLTNMAKNIKSIFKTNDEIEAEVNLLKEGDESTIGKIMVTKFNSFVKEYPLQYSEWEQLKIDGDFQKDKSKVVRAGGQNLGNVYGTLCAYYEYMQFKRGIFECTKLEYDDENTGRVTDIEFKFTGKMK